MKKESVFHNFLWRFLERCGAQGVTLIVSIVLARLLDPEVYGTLALVTVFITILQAFVDGGLGNALIQKKDADDLDFSSVFYFNMLVCLALYALMFFAAPWIASFYDKPELTPVIRVLSLTLVISGVKNIQQAYVSRNMLFKKFFFATLGGTIGAAAIGIYLAYKGYGVWALVAQHLFNLTVDTLILWITVKWRPKRMFSWARLKTLLSYGWKLLAAKLIDTGYNELRALIIGKKYSEEDLAFFNRGKQFPNLLTNNINDSIDSVLFPSMSKEQNNPETVKRMTRRAIMTSTFLMAPLMIGLAAIAETLIPVILGEKWLPCVPFLRIFCITFLFYPIHTANLNAIKALGRSEMVLKLEIMKKIVGFTLLLSSMWFGVMAMAYSLLVQSLCSQLINSWPNRKLLNYRYLDQIRDILPTLALSLAMGAAIYFFAYLPLHRVVVLGIQVLTGVGFYFAAAKLLHFESYSYVIDLAKAFLSKRHVKEYTEASGEA